MIGFMKKEIKNLEELYIFVSDFLSQMSLKKRATIITLSGDLGAGKTAFTKAAGQYFGIKEEMTSPTFVIQKEYSLKDHKNFKKLIHIDAYRLASASELEYLGWYEMIKNPENIIFIEWPEQVAGIDLGGAIEVSLNILDNEKRMIEVAESVDDKK